MELGLAYLKIEVPAIAR